MFKGLLNDHILVTVLPFVGHVSLTSSRPSKVKARCLYRKLPVGYVVLETLLETLQDLPTTCMLPPNSRVVLDMIKSRDNKV